MKRSGVPGSPSPAMIVAIVALIVALGGTSYAAINLPKNSVGTAQVRNKAVTTPKVRNNAVTTPKIRNGAVTRVKIANGAINGAKLAGGSVGSSKMAAIPAALVRASSIQSVPHFTSTKINLDSVVSDSGGIFDPTGKQMTVPRDGVYMLSAGVGWVANATGVRHLRIDVDGQAVISAIEPGPPATGQRQNAAGTIRLDAGQVVKLEVFQNSGGALNTSISSPQEAAWLSIAWLGN